MIRIPTAPGTSLLILAAVGCSTPEGTANYVGRVVSVSDGDTIRVLVDDTRMKVRLGEIDAPEQGQPCGNKSKKVLSELVSGKTVRVAQIDKDQYGRVVARVRIGELDVNAEMLRRGAAWAYRKHTKDRELFRLEKEARDARRGLWALPKEARVPPWKWRWQEGARR